MIKIQNNTPSREPIHPFLVGLNAESLADLSWTDPNLGVSDCAWWPERDISEPLSDGEMYDLENEELTINNELKVVDVKRNKIQAPPPTPPQSVTMRQARLALLDLDLLSSIDEAINAMPEPDKTKAKIEWEYAAVVERNSDWVSDIGQQLGLSDTQIDALFRLAATK